jgi:predicted regulator of Ras-like GTPase activity (Roadblock/LC7/MglB family)
VAKWKLSELFWRTEPVQTADGGAVEDAVSERKPNPATAALLSLRDVEGVVGSIAVQLDGSVWCRDLPPIFDADSTARLALRVAQLHEALTAEGDQFDVSALRYQGYRFHIARALPGLLGVLTREQVNLPALSMAMKLAGRKLSAQVAQGGAR